MYLGVRPESEGMPHSFKIKLTRGKSWPFLLRGVEQVRPCVGAAAELSLTSLQAEPKHPGGSTLHISSSQKNCVCEQPLASRQTELNNATRRGGGSYQPTRKAPTWNGYVIKGCNAGVRFHDEEPAPTWTNFQSVRWLLPLCGLVSDNLPSTMQLKRTVLWSGKTAATAASWWVIMTCSEKNNSYVEHKGVHEAKKKKKNQTRSWDLLCVRYQLWFISTGTIEDVCGALVTVRTTLSVNVQTLVRRWLARWAAFCLERREKKGAHVKMHVISNSGNGPASTAIINNNYTVIGHLIYETTDCF